MEKNISEASVWLSRWASGLKRRVRSQALRLSIWTETDGAVMFGHLVGLAFILVHKQALVPEALR